MLGIMIDSKVASEKEILHQEGVVQLQGIPQQTVLGGVVVGTKHGVVSQVVSVVGVHGYIRPNPVKYSSSRNSIHGLTSEPVTKMANKGGGEENRNNYRNNDINNRGANSRDNYRFNTLFGGNNDQ